MVAVSSLKSKKEISFVFDKGVSLSSFPIKLFYVKNSDVSRSNVAFTVGKKNVNLAVDRNKIKRRMREAFRLNCLADDFFSGHSLVFVYLGKKIICYESITKGFVATLTKFAAKK